MSEVGVLTQQQHHIFPAAAAVMHSDRRNSSSAATRKAAGAPVRRRISKACDRCNQLRTKCDGLAPCKHCVDNSLRCEYIRERKKRGKVSKKDLARMAAAAATTDQDPSPLPTSPAAQSQSPHDHQHHQHQHQHPIYQPTPPARAFSDASSHADILSSHSGTSPAANPLSRQGSVVSSGYKSTADFPFPGQGIQDVQYIHGADQQLFFASDFQIPSFPAIQQQANGFAENNVFNMPTPSAYSGYQQNLTLPQPVSQAISTPHPGPHNIPTFPLLPNMTHQPGPPVDLKYPVLRPVIPYLRNVIPLTLADALLEHYFSGSASSHPHPSSPYVIFFMFSRRSFLRQDTSRPCSPALLASMLWLAARTSEAKYLTSSPSARGKACQKLLELTIRLLRPLVHRTGKSEWNPGQDALETASLTEAEDAADADGVERSALGTLDDLITYIHLGTVVSASEYKAASLRWWNAAWGLARELKLGRELPANSTTSIRGDQPKSDEGSAALVTEEEREERRRVWWLLFCVDRHLSLCYNKPICLPDRECEGLLQPMDERTWHNSEFDIPAFDAANTPVRPSQKGPSVEFSGTSMYGFFTPLMTLLGEIIELNHARSHPRFGAAFINAGLWDEQARFINLRLENFAQSIRTYSGQMAEIAPQQASSNEGQRQQRRAIAYSTHLMHVLHILLTGKWDPVALLDDADLWIYTESFVQATGHAVSAAEAASDILEYDPEISHMPFFFGIYLLQGSFLLLLMADKLGRGAAPNVIKACEDIIRCHESCAITLSTEYQRNFRKVMRSTLAQVRGHASEDYGEQEQQRREVLSLYRWTGDGTGLAL